MKPIVAKLVAALIPISFFAIYPLSTFAADPDPARMLSPDPLNHPVVDPSTSLGNTMPGPIVINPANPVVGNPLQPGVSNPIKPVPNEPSRPGIHTGCAAGTPEQVLGCNAWHWTTYEITGGLDYNTGIKVGDETAGTEWTEEGAGICGQYIIDHPNFRPLPGYPRADCPRCSGGGCERTKIAAVYANIDTSRGTQFCKSTKLEDPETHVVRDVIELRYYCTDCKSDGKDCDYGAAVRLRNNDYLPILGEIGVGETRIDDVYGATTAGYNEGTDATVDDEAAADDSADLSSGSDDEAAAPEVMPPKPPKPQIEQAPPSDLPPEPPKQAEPEAPVAVD